MLVSPIEWLRQVIINVTEQAPMVVHEQTSPTEGRYVVSLSINTAGIREQRLGQTIIIHVNSTAAQQPHVAACSVVRQALIQIERQINHVFPHYSYFKIKEFKCNKPDVTQMPKRISPAYQLPIV